MFTLIDDIYIVPSRCLYKFVILKSNVNPYHHSTSQPNGTNPTNNDNNSANTNNEENLTQRY